MEDLTKEQKHFIIALYKKYLDRTASMSQDQARVFPDAAYIKENIFPSYSLDKIVSLCGGMRRAGYVTCKYYDNQVFRVTITDKTIIYMENRFTNGIKEIAEFLSNFIP